MGDVVEDNFHTLRSDAERERRLGMLMQPHIQPLMEYLEGIRKQQGESYDMPSFDPCDGGIHAKVLFLLEAPGPRAVGSTFISCNNPDQTAKNMWTLLRNANIRRSDIVLWNIVPWYVGDGQHIRPVNKDDLAAAKPYLKSLLDLLPDLQAIVLIGMKAQTAEKYLREWSSLPIFKTYHMSPLVFNSSPVRKQHVEETFQQVADLLKAKQQSSAKD